MSDKKGNPIVIALGYFDSVHLGHQKVIKSASDFAKKNNLKLVVFTFLGNVKAVINKSQEKSVYTLKEREKLLKELGADEIYFAPITKEFLSKDKKVFLDELNEQFNIYCYVSGVDYTFGNLGKGNVEYLSDYAKEHNQEQIVVETYSLFNQKVSTTMVKELLSKGEVQKINAILGRNYSLTGVVKKDRQVGNKLGFPTANIKIDKEKYCLKDGVYYCKTTIDGQIYDVIVNYGGRPTFNLDEKVIEAHIIDYCGDLYDKEIKIEFIDTIRDIKKFDNEEQLKEQLTKDVNFAKGKKYD